MLRTKLSLCACISAALLPTAVAQTGGDPLLSTERFSTVPGSGGAQIDSADVNSDGNMDLVVTENAAGGFSVDGEGGYTLFGSHRRLTFSQNAAIGDINNDGDVDVVIREALNSNELTLFLGNGDGTFGAGIAENFGLTNILEIQIGDLDGDGNPELVAMTFLDADFSSQLNILPGLAGPGFFGPAETTALGVNTDTFVRFVDLNDDAAPELVITAGFPVNGHLVLMNDGAGVLTQSEQGFLDAQTNLLLPVTVADANGDGNTDLIFGGRIGGAGTVGVMEGNGAGEFGTVITSTVGRNAVESVVADDF